MESEPFSTGPSAFQDFKEKKEEDFPKEKKTDQKVRGNSLKCQGTWVVRVDFEKNDDKHLRNDEELPHELQILERPKTFEASDSPESW